MKIPILGSASFIDENNTHYQRVLKTHGDTHNITPARLPRSGRVDLTKLSPNQSIVSGDYDYFYFILTKKP